MTIIPLSIEDKQYPCTHHYYIDKGIPFYILGISLNHPWGLDIDVRRVIYATLLLL